MTDGERERETIRRLREGLEQRQSERTRASAEANVDLDLDIPDAFEERAEVLYELTCL